VKYKAAAGQAVRQSLSHDFLGVRQSVDGGGVDPVDAAIERFVDGGNGVGVILRTTAKGPASASDCSGTEADSRRSGVT
jgi:hypothetical protein